TTTYALSLHDALPILSNASTKRLCGGWIVGGMDKAVVPGATLSDGSSDGCQIRRGIFEPLLQLRNRLSARHCAGAHGPCRAESRSEEHTSELQHSQIS